MKAEELRIGNLVYLPSKAVYAVDVLYRNYDMLKVWEPIPLTEEWLLKFGFKENVKDFFENDFMLSIWRDPKTFNGFMADWADKTIGEIKHVHQLQNLYFCLTGEELTLKQ